MANSSFTRRRSVLEKPTYWVRSKQINETAGFGPRSVPARFKTLEEAKLYRRELNLRRGAYHPGYFVELQDDSAPPFIAGAKKPSGIVGS